MPQNLLSKELLDQRLLALCSRHAPPEKCEERKTGHADDGMRGDNDGPFHR